jgi:hypothetical protein
MTIARRLDRLAAWQRTEAETFTTALESRLAAAVPDFDPEDAALVVADWCAADSTLEARWLASYQMLGVMDADGQIGGDPR